MMEHICLIEMARSWKFNQRRTAMRWERRSRDAIVRVHPSYKEIPRVAGGEEFVEFCWSELVLYKPFRSYENDIGLDRETIIRRWQLLQYRPWHVDRIPYVDSDDEMLDEIEERVQRHDDMEWEMLSRMGPRGNNYSSDFDYLGRRDFDIAFDWSSDIVDRATMESATTFIRERSMSAVTNNIEYPEIDVSTLSRKQRTAYNRIVQHHMSMGQEPPLHMVICGTAGTGKSYLIKVLRGYFSRIADRGRCPLLVMAPTGIAAFNIGAATIHSSLRIPIKEMNELNGSQLISFQERMKYVQYILIDEMSFVGPKLLSRIDERLREAFPDQRNNIFGGRSIILVGDFAQLPPVMDRPIYAATVTGRSLWVQFDTCVVLDVLFRQSGNSASAAQFRTLLTNIRNAVPTIEDWNLLMQQTTAMKSGDENFEFDMDLHLCAINSEVHMHNKKMLKELNVPVARIHAKENRNRDAENIVDDELDTEILLAVGSRVMLTANLWIEHGLVNGALGRVKKIVYMHGIRPPELPAFVIVEFDNYNGPAWIVEQQRCVPIAPIVRSRRRQLPLRLSWALTIHKSQGLTLPRATINIGKAERQGLTFTALSRVKELHCIRIAPPFDYDRYARLGKGAYVALRKKEEQRLQEMSL